MRFGREPKFFEDEPEETIEVIEGRTILGLKNRVLGYPANAQGIFRQKVLTPEGKIKYELQMFNPIPNFGVIYIFPKECYKVKDLPDLQEAEVVEEKPTGNEESQNH